MEINLTKLLNLVKNWEAEAERYNYETRGVLQEKIRDVYLDCSFQLRELILEEERLHDLSEQEKEEYREKISVLI